MLLCLCSGVIFAQDNGAHDLLIYGVWVRPTAPALEDGATAEAMIPGTVSGAYLTIQNTSDQDYALVGVSDDLAEMSQLHAMSMAGGVMKMQMIDHLDIPAGGTVTLDPMHYHVMLEDVTRDLYPDSAVALVLTFANASGVTFDVPVGAFVTDFPVDETSLIVANAQMVNNAAGGLDMRLVIDNRGEQDDALVGFSMKGETDLVGSTPIALSAGTQTAITLDVAMLGDMMLADGAIPLILTFESGETQRVGVVMVDDGAMANMTAEAAATSVAGS